MIYLAIKVRRVQVFNTELIVKIESVEQEQQRHAGERHVLALMWYIRIKLRFPLQQEPTECFR